MKWIFMHSYQIRVLISWFLKLFLLAGQTIGHTIVLAMTLEHFGLHSVPLLFLAIGVSTLIGTLLLRFLPKTIKKEHLILLYSSVLLAYLILILSLGTFGPIIASIVIALGILQMPLGIITSYYIEELFSPLEARRSLPLIESTEGISMVASGLTIIGSLVLGISVPSLLWLWLASHIGLTAIFGIWLLSHKKVPSLHHLLPESFFKQEWNISFATPLKALMLSMFLIVPLAELYFTSSFVELFGEKERIITTGIALFLAASGILILCNQFFIAPKLLARSGSMGTLLSAILMTTLAAGLSLLFPGFWLAALVRLTHEGFLPVFKLGYVSTLYAIPISKRLEMKSFVDGIIIPSAMIFASGLVVVLEKLIHGEILWPLLAVFILCITGLAFAFFPALKKRYTDYLVSNLHNDSHTFKKTLLQILSEPGHDTALNTMHRLLKMPREQEEIKVQILNTLSTLKKQNSLPVIFESVRHENNMIRLAALQALQEYSWNKENVFEQGFSRFHLLKILRELFARETNDEVKMTIVDLLAKIDHEHVIEFLVSALEDSDPLLRAHIIRVMGRFPDPHIYHFIEPYTRDANAWIRAYAVAALWQFPQYRLELLVQIVKLLSEGNSEAVQASTFLLGELRSQQEHRTLLKRLEEGDSEIALEAALALVKIGDYCGVDTIVENILTKPVLLRKVERELGTETKSMRVIMRALENAVIHKISEHILLFEGNENVIDEMEKLYHLVGAEEELYHLENLRTTSSI
ncbi:MAG: hypothetical protein A2V81_00240 [Candidatus Abawacabacteria bacterium RBG_16_42_10]|uniref:Uncharacterized protein n=1 Tax=Candidatus Abawacabacteria bacterium RBG_16_42_10 TaxID=1817814 RepID=A0A1F4XLC1_9BACT|nr:MAG: hypothetical protein A2V81_00240 [Candidatus Abawacabacteria bacterium RBG_16_42_10]